ncbi:MAG TPA: 3-methyl-2-oxobutanoate hydroxymethyltransferase [Roseiflexaceae bacterium]|nr:3-methyl-2-oxobutanoate hydroxymethyltransferase [Roseiflexaceae bacterium]
MRVTISDIQRMRDKGERFCMLTAYDYTSAQILDAAGIPLLLVGDSLGVVIQGHETTIPVTVDEIIYHTRAVLRGARKALVVADLPFMSYTITPEQAMANAARLIQEGGAQAVKLEGGAPMAALVRRLTESGIPVMGHLGFTPQSVHQIGLRVQGKRAEAARQLLADAQALEEAGAFAVVLELVPAPLARAITERLRIPTIGIGAGAGTSGQVQVWHDLVGLYTDMQPRHAKRYLSLAGSIGQALRAYQQEVRDGVFPAAANAASMDEEELRKALE